MLSKLGILFLISVFSFFLLSSLSFALTDCSPCDVSNCLCSIDECSSGILRIYSSSTCRGVPKYEYTFSSHQFKWTTATVGTYYFKAFCSGDETTSCIDFTVRSSGATTSTIKPTTTTLTGCKTDSDCFSDEECIGGSCVSKKADYTWVFALIIIIIVVLVVVLLFLKFMKKEPKKSFEEIYKKWTK